MFWVKPTSIVKIEQKTLPKHKYCHVGRLKDGRVALLNGKETEPGMSLKSKTEYMYSLLPIVKGKGNFNSPSFAMHLTELINPA